MTDTTLISERYLAQLNTALTGVSAEVRNEILAGVAEQLTGLDDDAAARVIAELGDPEFIASEARGASETVAVAEKQRVVDSTGFAVVAAVLVMAGGVVVPFVGWVVGVVLVWLSSRWKKWERWVATFVPAAGAVLAIALILLLRAAPTASDVTANPLVPAVYDLVWTGMILVPIVAAAVGIWLLIIALRRA